MDTGLSMVTLNFNILTSAHEITVEECEANYSQCLLGKKVSELTSNNDEVVIKTVVPIIETQDEVCIRAQLVIETLLKYNKIELI